MKRWKKMIRNCPYLVALFSIWMFLTIGGVGLLLYRDYGGMKWKTFLSNPFFALIMEEEMHESAVRTAGSEAETVMAHAANELAGSEAMKGAVLDRITGQDEKEAVKDDNEADKESSGKDAEAKAKVRGKTFFDLYPPVETDSIYFEDVGKIALTTEYPYTKVEEGYFKDAAFLGDSRTIGIADYAGLDADFYCDNGMTIYKLLGEKGVTYQRTGEKVNLPEVLQQKKYGKIYIMLGMNELGYRNTGYFLEQYQAVLEQIRNWQPHAIIFIMANLHVSQTKNNIQTEFNNININAKNVAAASLADGVDIFYLDSNPLFTDQDGLLKEDLTFDGVHLYANNYPEWREFLMMHGVVKDDEKEDTNAPNSASNADNVDAAEDEDQIW